LSKKKEKTSFRATLIGLLDGARLEIHAQAESDKLKEALEKAAYDVLKVGTKKATRQPAPPFTTSTLQQEAWRKLRFTAKQTMAIAQQLYEGLPVGSEGSVGLITYMRTDSTRVASSAVGEAIAFIREKYGQKYLPPRPRAHVTRTRGAQEAHEAIRPTRIHREPALIKKYLNASQFRLYDLVWKRMVASQMPDAVFDSTTVEIDARSRVSDTRYAFRATGSVLRFPGFRALSAISMTFQIFPACISPRLPPALVKSWAAAKTVRPLTRPKPVITASAGVSFSPRPNSVERCFTKSWVSWNDSGSKNLSSRSRAVSFPSSCCFRIRLSPPIFMSPDFFASYRSIFSFVKSCLSFSTVFSSLNRVADKAITNLSSADVMA